MTGRSRLLALTATLLVSAALPAHADMMFNRVATFAVANNLPGADTASPTSACEIIAASEDGNTLVYSDSPHGGIGFVDITDPGLRKPAVSVKRDGEPTSVTVIGGKVLAGVNTSKVEGRPCGQSLASSTSRPRRSRSTCDLGGQPDLVALSKDGKFLAIAIENERDEEVNDGEIPQMPGGNLKIALDERRHAGLRWDQDGRSEWHGRGCAGRSGAGVRCLQRGRRDRSDAAGEQPHRHRRWQTARSSRISPLGRSTLDKDRHQEGWRITFDGKMEKCPREPDAVKWLDNDRFVVANEGDYKGGSRGFTIFAKGGDGRLRVWRQLRV